MKHCPQVSLEPHSLVTNFCVKCTHDHQQQFEGSTTDFQRVRNVLSTVATTRQLWRRRFDFVLYFLGTSSLPYLRSYSTASLLPLILLHALILTWWALPKIDCVHNRAPAFVERRATKGDCSSATVFLNRVLTSNRAAQLHTNASGADWVHN